MLIMNNIYVTKSFMPPLEEYVSLLHKVWDNGILTNQGPLLREFEQKIKEYLDVKNFQFLTNGTIALQVAIKALDITDGEIITTPFSYVATISSILWERCTPVFVDINPDNFCIDADKIEAAITPQTKAIMPVHVFGYPCDVEKIAEIAKKHNLKVIYDAAHTFGAKYKGKSLSSYGDISVLSFHATKIFHTIEGGAIIATDNTINTKVDLIKRFGHNDDQHSCIGTNAKSSEFSAAMGLANFPYLNEVIQNRKQTAELYDRLLKDVVYRPRTDHNCEYNYAYYPVVLKDEKTLLNILDELKQQNIFPRRYFYPSLNTLSYVNYTSCPVSEDISSRILCLPLYVDLDKNVVKEICTIIKKHNIR